MSLCVCGVSFPTREIRLKLHFKIHHPNVDIKKCIENRNIDSVVCGKCKKSFETQGQMESHKRKCSMKHITTRIQTS